MNKDNKYGMCCKCPAQMSDGRIFTNYMNNTRMNEYMKDMYDITNNHTYRLWLQRNAVDIIKSENAFHNKYKKCQYPYRFWLPQIPRPVENNY